MKGDDIARRQHDIEHMIATSNEPRIVEFGSVCVWLAEIAYQLAKMNEGSNEQNSVVHHELRRELV